MSFDISQPTPTDDSQLVWVRPNAEKPAHLTAEPSTTGAATRFDRPGTPTAGRYTDQDFIHFASALIAAGWTITHIPLTDSHGQPFDSVRQASFEAILTHDLIRYPAAEVLSAHHRDLRFIHLAGFTAEHGDLTCSLNTHGTLSTNATAAVLRVFNSVDSRLLVNRVNPLTITEAPTLITRIKTASRRTVDAYLNPNLNPLN